MLGGIDKFHKERAKMNDNPIVVKKVMTQLIDDKEKNEYNLQNVRNETFASLMVGVKSMNQYDPPPPRTYRSDTIDEREAFL